MTQTTPVPNTNTNSVVAPPAFTLEGKTPSELEQRRREIVLSLTQKYRGYDDPEVPLELLQELAAITSTLRRKTAGPPKVAKTSKSKAPKASINDLMI